LIYQEKIKGLHFISLSGFFLNGMHSKLMAFHLIPLRDILLEEKENTIRPYAKNPAVANSLSSRRGLG
jgi:hypothetical protein